MLNSIDSEKQRDKVFGKYRRQAQIVEAVTKQITSEKRLGQRQKSQRKNLIREALLQRILPPPKRDELKSRWEDQMRKDDIGRA